MDISIALDSKAHRLDVDASTVSVSGTGSIILTGRVKDLRVGGGAYVVCELERSPRSIVASGRSCVVASVSRRCTVDVLENAGAVVDGGVITASGRSYVSARSARHLVVTDSACAVAHDVRIVEAFDESVVDVICAGKVHALGHSTVWCHEGAHIDSLEKTAQVWATARDDAPGGAIVSSVQSVSDVVSGIDRVFVQRCMIARGSDVDPQVAAQAVSRGSAFSADVALQLMEEL